MPDNSHYYTSDSLWKIWLVESIQSIHNSLWTWHDKCTICCRYCIYHVKFNVCLVTKPHGVVGSETKWLNASLRFASLLSLRMNYVDNQRETIPKTQKEQRGQALKSLMNTCKKRTSTSHIMMIKSRWRMFWNGFMQKLDKKWWEPVFEKFHDFFTIWTQQAFQDKRSWRYTRPGIRRGE